MALRHVNGPLSPLTRFRLSARRLRQLTAQALRHLHRERRAYRGYLRDLDAYLSLEGAGRVSVRDLRPYTHERTAQSLFDTHYVYQDLWAFKKILGSRVERHVDVGSRIDFIAMLTAITRVTFIDLRPLEADFEGLDSRRGNILEMPFADGSVPSLSCLHVAEHVGLGRYGDALDPHGSRKAMGELRRVLAPGGNLYFSLPVGRPRVCFNSHRVHSSAQVLEGFSGLELVEFSGVDDRGEFRARRAPAELDGCVYGCGMFCFTRAR